MGALRLSDIENNVVIATTDIEGISKTPKDIPISELELFTAEEQIKLQKKEKKHYSAASKGQWVFGTRMVYTDLMITNESYKLETISE